MEQTNQPEKMVQQTALMKFMEFLSDNHYHIDHHMVDKYWELITWEREYDSEQQTDMS